MQTISIELSKAEALEVASVLRGCARAAVPSESIRPRAPRPVRQGSS